jgi:hypothetical protein
MTGKLYGGNHLKESGPGVTKKSVNLTEAYENHEILSKYSWCNGQDSKEGPIEYSARDYR